MRKSVRTMKYTKDEHRYDDMINLPHHQSKERVHMSMHDRAAQFAPFAALTGHSAVIKETARLTEDRIEVDEYTKKELNGKLQYILEHLDEEPEVSFTYFVPDKKKSGGAYVTKTGTVKKMQEFERRIVMKDDTEIPMEAILRIESDILDGVF